MWALVARFRAEVGKIGEETVSRCRRYAAPINLPLHPVLARWAQTKVAAARLDLSRLPLTAKFMP